MVCSQPRGPWAPGMVAEWVCTGAWMALDRLEAQPSWLVDRVSIRHHESSPLHPTPWHLKPTGSSWQCWAHRSSSPSASLFSNHMAVLAPWAPPNSYSPLRVPLTHLPTDAG